LIEKGLQMTATPKPATEPLLTAAETACLLGISLRTVELYAGYSILPSVFITSGGRRRRMFDRLAVVAAWESRRQQRFAKRQATSANRSARLRSSQSVNAAPAVDTHSDAVA
jgi:hypothetical protein